MSKINCQLRILIWRSVNFISFLSPRKYCYKDNGSNLNAIRSSLFKILKSIVQTNAYEKFEYKGIKTV